MSKFTFLLMAFLTTMFATLFADTPPARADVCYDGQTMAARNPCTCRPPLKFLPGDICGSGRKTSATPQQGGSEGFVHAICEPGMVPAASGCRCEAPMAVLPGGRCGRPTAAGAACKEGDSWKITHCVCRAPLKRIENGRCGRLARNETESVFKHGQCKPGDDIKATSCGCVAPLRTVSMNGRYYCR